MQIARDSWPVRAAHTGARIWQSSGLGRAKQVNLPHAQSMSLPVGCLPDPESWLSLRPCWPDWSPGHLKMEQREDCATRAAKHGTQIGSGPTSARDVEAHGTSKTRFRGSDPQSLAELLAEMSAVAPRWPWVKTPYPHSPLK